VQIVSACEPILNSFIDAAKDNAQYGDDIQFFDKSDNGNWDEDDKEEEYVLNVFVKKLIK
jgi:hypothetical protein